MVKVMEDASLPSFGCFAHLLQLVVHVGLLSQRAVKDLLATCRFIVELQAIQGWMSQIDTYPRESETAQVQAQAGC